MKSLKRGPQFGAKENIPSYDGKKRCQVTTQVRLIPNVKDALDRAAKDRDMSRNMLVNEILAEKLGITLDA